MGSDTGDARRTAPLAFWRYGHDYLRAAADLCRDHRTLCGETQVPYHLCAQGLEFALHAYLRAKAVTETEIRFRYRHALEATYSACTLHGLPPLPVPCAEAFAQVAACHRSTAFIYLDVPDDGVPDIGPLLDAGTWILGQAAPLVSQHYVEHLGGAGSPSADEFAQRLRTALSVLREGSRAM
jgi:hypothetical protein